MSAPDSGSGGAGRGGAAPEPMSAADAMARIAAFVLLFFAFSWTGQLGASLLTGEVQRWVGIAIATAAAVAAGWISLVRFDERPPGALGFAPTRAAPREAVIGTAIGGALIGATALLLLASGSLRYVPDEGSARGYLVPAVGLLGALAMAAALEELLFRGYPFQVLVAWIGPWSATVLSSALFAALHGWNPHVTVPALANIFVAGVLISIAYLQTRSLWYATGVHLGWNWVMTAVLDFPVSGLALFDVPLYDVALSGPGWWTGGRFGPEAGLAATVVLAAGVALLLRLRPLGEAEGMRRLGPLVDTRLGPGEP